MYLSQQSDDTTETIRLIFYNTDIGGFKVCIIQFLLGSVVE